MPLFFGPHLSFLADLLHITLSTYHRIHRSMRLMSFILLLFHVLTLIAVGASFPLSDLGNLHRLIVRIHNSTSRTFTSNLQRGRILVRSTTTTISPRSAQALVQDISLRALGIGGALCLCTLATPAFEISFP
jgi:hypothetical protein